MISTELKSLARNTARVLIAGLPGVSDDFPTGILSKSEQRSAREVIVLSVQDNDIEKQVERYNAEVCVDLFKRFVLHHQCEKLYIGGLARIPFLVAYGVFLRNVSNITYFDKMHGSTDWRILDNEDVNIQLSNTESLPKADENGNVGLAVGLSTPILQDQLPFEFKNNTAILSSTTLVERNLVLNQENLQRLSSSLLATIDVLSRDPKVRRIHLFLSVQSSLAIEIGRKFQEGIHKTWVIHNFNGNEGHYEWALELSGKGVEIYD
ncbi:SAVED domain-containing protein [Pseudoalteromonas sp. SR44-2]|uniref:SAVED domain-containing protein n=1 Tax=Pseudoalteromonas sp. SR44-2 TaxID=2760937 RepID=UPI0016017501|nr:SAVED domain-containing protein [Pseudoalteromonas sp. SR44-2]MBB1339291.1 SAVED domain-containing protein [Pseudoalteromonas sp. SR44-2]